jgi:hypothetical protein
MTGAHRQGYVSGYGQEGRAVLLTGELDQRVERHQG